VAIEVVVPIRDLDTAKTRLAAALPPVERKLLSTLMLSHVVRVLSESKGIRSVWVVGGAEEERDLALSNGGRWIPEAEDDLNHTLNAVRETLLGNGAHCVGIVLGDLPMLERSDVEGLLSHMRRGAYDICIAPDTHERGTNAVFVRSAWAFTFQFGVESLRRHLKQAVRRGLRATCWRTPGFGLDVDTPSDLAQFRDHCRGEHSPCRQR